MPAGLPSHVRQIAAEPVAAIPKATALNSHEAMRLLAKIRRSELRKARALRQAVQHSDKTRTKIGAARKPRKSPYAVK